MGVDTEDSHWWQRNAALIAVFAGLLTSGCKPVDLARQALTYVTTPCPFGTDYVVSRETGTPGLRKFTEKWCEERDGKGDPVRYGPYVEFYESGTKKESGRYSQGARRDGPWKRWYPGGQLQGITVYDHGKPVSFAAWHENGLKWEEGGFDNGFKHGTWIRWHKNGQKEFEGHFDHGVLDQHYTLWHDNGQKEEDGEYEHGVRQGLWVKWHPNGQKRSEILFQNGKPNDWYKAWHENGQQSEQALFHEGKPEGMYTIWHDNGQKEEEGSYHDGVLDGQVTAWDRDGHVWLKTEYKGGSLVEDPLPQVPLGDAGEPPGASPPPVR